MNLARIAPVSIFVLAIAAGCGGSKPEPKTAETPSEPPAAPATDTSLSATGSGSGHEGHTMSGTHAGATGTSSSTGSTGTTGPSSATGSTAAPTGDTSTTAAASLNDDQILQIVHTANTGEIEQAKIAQQKTKNAKVKAFAAMMIKEHTDADTKGNELAKKSKLSPSDSPVSTALKADSEKTVEQLKSQNGVELDRTYIDAQIKAHQMVLDTIDNKLLPNVKNAELKTMLQTIRPKIEGHLKEAQSLQSSLGMAK